MKRSLTLVLSLVSLSASAAAPSGGLTAAQIADRNVSARGGLAAWRAVNALTLSGQLDAGGKQPTKLPFVATFKRPHKERLELRFEEQTALQVYDGNAGWKVRPFLGRNEVEPFSAAEAKSAAASTELDGPLVDYARKGTHVELLGTEPVEGHRAYKLKLTMKDGSERRVWVDASSFLELKIDGEPRMLDGKMHKVAVYYRDYKREGGLMIPHVLETAVEGVKKTHAMTIDKVAINPPADDALFAKPQLAMEKTSGQ